MIRLKTLLVPAILSIVTSCSPKIEFTQSIREQYKLTPEEIRGIQFYLSDPVILRRGEDEKAQKTTEEGTLIIQSGKSLDQVTFKAFTPGAVESVVDNTTLKVAFEDGVEKQLVFGSSRSRNGFYQLQAMTWENGKGKVNYGGHTWYSGKGSDQAILLFKMKSIKRIRVNDQVAKGKKIR